MPTIGLRIVLVQYLTGKLLRQCCVLREPRGAAVSALRYANCYEHTQEVRDTDESSP